MQREHGFSLMEALVAIAVFATAATGLISLNTSSIQISAQLTERALARQVADNIAVATVTNPQLQVFGSSKGEETQRRRTFVWERSITPAPREDLIEITIRVRLDDKESVLGEVTLLHRKRADR